LNRLYLRSKNKFIQRALDSISIFRKGIIKEGTLSGWIYDRLLKRVFFEIILNGNWKRALYLFKFRSRLIINQRFKVDPYLDWIITNEPADYELQQQRDEASKLSTCPLFSIVTPVYHPPVHLLTDMLDSVCNQTYKNWEHCVVNADPHDEKSRHKIELYSQKDHRINAKTLLENLGISSNTNEAIKMAKGEWIAFLDHDDQLAPFALFEVYKYIQQHPDVDVLYSDEDKFRHSDHHRFSPFFKPDYNLDYLRSLNYMDHFVVVRKSLGDSIGWLDPAYDGSQDYDLLLKLTERTKNIYHVPKILYHWKMTEGSVAETLTNKPYAVRAGEKALLDHLNRCEVGASVEVGKFPYEAHYKISPEPKISMVIPNRDNYLTLKCFLDSIFNKSTYSNFELIIVENGSVQKDIFTYYDFLLKNPKVKIIEWKEEFNFSSVNNYGEANATGDVILLLNNDLEVISENWLERMLEHCLRSDIGAVGAKLIYPNNTIQHAGVIVGMFGAAGHSQKYYDRSSPGYYYRLICNQNYSALTAACLMVRREVFKQVGGLDPAFKVEFGDVDFCLRILHHGYRNLWTPFAELYHHESLTRGANDTKEKKQLNEHEVALFQDRWADFLKKGDPSYNPNLTLEIEDFGFNYG
jgi:O-antigen biosynthesis protein